ncbi:transglutaminase family protein [Iodidimonas sp. SYSU 1G8]|uniref:transglutaminase family protein n=1 Tax=Iodidimonas sp. SYSU 1G8 TaxID=3133967 RepID=UPI0031FF1F99
MTGVRYEISQTTHYEYANDVALSSQLVRLSLVDRPGLTVLHQRVDIDPTPTTQRAYLDFFGNENLWLSFLEPHGALIIETHAIVERDAPAPPAAKDTPAWEEVRDTCATQFDPGPDSPAHFLFPSRRVSLDPQITAYAARSFKPGRPILEAVTELSNRIYTGFEYAPGVTDVASDPREAFDLRKGVCQDFAHVMIAGMRGLGLAAGYVSGYLRTIPPPGKKRLQGADAMHAWVAVWCGDDHGWVEIDPTNARLAGNDHIPLAWGRDYVDVAPVKGVIRVSGAHTLKATVDVLELETEKPLILPA